ncbi:MAG TPA: hypothetical protein VHN17_09660 [Steroidobacteraceae bacterium]|jgi:hypothetical protein|nr:hypothetical protein [Steroidobacteraceae bacterium]
MSGAALAADNDTVRLGLLMEAAQSHQELVDGSLRQLQAHTRGLDEVVRDEIRRVMSAELAELMEEATRAAEVLRALARAARLRAALWSTLAAVVPGAVVAIFLWWWLPSPAQMAALRSQHAHLAAAVARLSSGGGRIDLRRCGDTSRLCVRIDRHAPAYGEQADYLVVRGY